MAEITNRFGRFVDVSEELAEGIARVEREIAERVAGLGGYGARVIGVGPDGREHAGTLVAGSTPDQGPYVLDASGKRWRCPVLELAEGK